MRPGGFDHTAGARVNDSSHTTGLGVKGVYLFAHGIDLVFGLIAGLRRFDWRRTTWMRLTNLNCRRSLAVINS